MSAKGMMCKGRVKCTRAERVGGVDASRDSSVPGGGREFKGGGESLTSRRTSVSARSQSFSIAGKCEDVWRRMRGFVRE